MLLIAASLALMVLDHRERLGQPVKQALALAVYPVHVAVNLPFEVADFFGEQLHTRRYLIEENDRLKSQQLLYQARLQRMDALERENINLRELLQSAYQMSDSVLIAELVRVELDPYAHLIEIDKGSRAEVFVGQPVLDAHGVMGQVDQVSPLHSVVRLITDPSHGLPVQVNRNGIRGIAVGTGDIQQLELTNVPNNADIQVGDLLVTSGLGGRFPVGYPVARITVVEQDPGKPFARIKAKPEAALDRSREVLLVRTAYRNRAAEAAPAAPAATSPSTTTAPPQ